VSEVPGIIFPLFEKSPKQNFHGTKSGFAKTENENVFACDFFSPKFPFKKWGAS
jgi:hypothetical protein